jgi:hydroxypyruvate reductase
MTKTISAMREDARNIFLAATRAVEGQSAVDRHCCRQGHWFQAGDHRVDLDSIDSLLVVGAGKATASMAKAIEALLGERISDGLIAVPYGHMETLGRIRQIEAGHPVPDENGMRAAAAIVEMVSRARETDLVLCLISGGGSALLPLPAPGISLSDKQAVNRLLLACGASIHEINTVRKHISGIKGGQLARAAYPAKLLTLVISDVIGDDLDIIASGPTVADPGTFQDAMQIIRRCDLAEKLPQTVAHHLARGLDGTIAETPKPGEPIFERVAHCIVAANIQALLAAEAEAGKRGYHPLILSSRLAGDAGAAAAFHLSILEEIHASNRPVAAPACILSGGETTVAVRGHGLGGRNQEFALHAVSQLSQLHPAVMLSAGTDGRDGPTDAAGAFADSTSWVRAQESGLDPDAFLRNNDSYTFFSRLGDLLKTGPTRTNVMDVRIMMQEMNRK